MASRVEEPSLERVVPDRAGHSIQAKKAKPLIRDTLLRYRFLF
jgi:hypothetical protein